MKRLRLGLSHPGVERPKLLTLTSRPLEPPYRSRELLSRRFAEVRRRLGRAFPGSSINYAGAVELTGSGRVHFHVVLRGVPFMPQAVWSRLAAECGFGYVVDVRQVRSAHGMGAYLSKDLGGYLTKQAGSIAWPMHFRRIRFSHDWAPSWDPRPKDASEAPEVTWALLEVVPPWEWRRAWESGQGPPAQPAER